MSETPRFSWPKRLLISFLLFDMVYHSLAVLAPYDDWLEDFKVPQFPKPLPTWAEINQLAATKLPNGRSLVAERLAQSWATFGDYFNPCPSEQTRSRIDSAEDWGRYVLAWTTSRLDFLENLVGLPQRWTMFSPWVTDEWQVARLRLVFADGSIQEVRLHADPKDLTHYHHWFQEKVLCYELCLHTRGDARLGYYRYLARRHSVNAVGSPLVKIYTYFVTYHAPEPGMDAATFLRAQNGPPGWEKAGPKYVYEAGRDCELIPRTAERK
jgi:hypothetical protein